MPTIPDTLSLALQHHQAGRLQEAEALYRQILQSQPDQPTALHYLGVIAHHGGRHADAVALIGSAIEREPAVAAFHNNLGAAYFALGKVEEASSYYHKALALKPRFAEAFFNMGNVLKAQGRLEEAVDRYRQALTINPSYLAAYFNLGNALRDEGKLEEAVHCFRQALAYDPAFAKANNNLGSVLRTQGKVEEAVNCYRQAIAYSPDCAEAYCNWGQALHAQGKLEEAAGCYRQAVAVKPGFVEAYNSLGAVLAEQDRLAEAEKAYVHALVLKPDFFEVHANLGGALVMQGKLKEGVDHYRQALALRPHDGVRILIATALPVIAESKARLQSARQSFREQVSELFNRKLSIADPLKEVNATNFYLAYQGLNDRALQIKVARLYGQACPSLLYTASHCVRGHRPATAARRKIRVGFLSRYFYRHPVGASFNGLVELSAKSGRLEVVLLSVGTVRDEFLRKTAAACSAHVQVPPDLDKARQTVADLGLDVLVYPDIGMDPLSYFLAFGRLALVQCVMGGHPVTTGISNMDYFLSSEFLETDSAQRHYSETLVKFKSLPAFVPRPEYPPVPKSRADLGLPADRSLYICPVKLQKMHPDFDHALARILRGDSRGEVILFKDRLHNAWHELLTARFARSMPDVAERVRFLPWARSDEFLSILMQADAVLDPFYFGLGTTALVALAAGAPVVTWPSELLRGRVTLACYKKMKIMDCVARNPRQYVKIAVRLGTDQGWRETMKKNILGKSSALFEDTSAVGEFERFCVQAVKAACGAPITRFSRDARRK